MRRTVHPALDALLLDQAGVVSRRQAHEAGLAAHDLARMLRRRDLTRLHPGVYVDHTGEPTFVQQCWAGVLLYWPAALAGQTAMRAAEGPGSRRPGWPIELAVRTERRVEPPPGLTVLRTDRLDEQVLWNVGPPRFRYEEAAIDVAAAAASDFLALDALSSAIQSRRTTAGHMLASAFRRTRLSRREWIEGVLADVSTGVSSVLEHGYVHRVERPHGLGDPRRQVRDKLGAGAVYRDVLYPGGLIVELDGRLFHDTTSQRDRDFDRDLDAAAEGASTIRLSYGQVFDRACWTAERIGRVRRRHGWNGMPVPCGAGCPMARAA